MEDIRAFLRLLVAVLNQAIRDVEFGEKLERNSALSWIFDDAPSHRMSFEQVCSWLGLDPDLARTRLLERKRFAYCYKQWFLARQERTVA